MKVNIKALKKISMAYTLQVFAVVLLFFFVGSSSANKVSASKIKEPAANIGLPLLINKNDFINPYKDFSLTGKAVFYGKPIQPKAGN